MALANLKVIGVMGRGNLHASGSKLLIHIMIGNDRNLPSHQRKDQGLSDQILIPFILRVYCYRRITQKRLRPGGGDLYKASLFPLHRIVDVPEEAVLLLVLHLCIGDRSLTYRTPINNAGSFIDQSLLIQLDKYLLHRIGTPFIHGETLPVPICGGTHLLKLAYDTSAVFFLPLPGLL